MARQIRLQLCCVLASGCSFLSLVLSGWFLLFFVVPVLSIGWIDRDRLHGRSLATLLSDLAQRYPIVILLSISTIAALATGLSFALTYWLDQSGPKTAPAAIARRLTRAGLFLVGCDILIVGSVLGFRLYLRLT